MHPAHLTRSIQIGGRPVSALSLLARASPRFAARVLVRGLVTPPRRPPSPAEAAFAASLEPPESLDGLAVRTLGEGPKVLLVHGWGSRSTRLFRIAEAVARRRAQAVLVDLPAHGASDGRETNAEAATAALLRLGRVLGPFAGVVGHSFGGSVAAMAVARGLPAKRLVVLGSPSRYADVVDVFADRLKLEVAVVVQLRRELQRRIGVDIDTLDVAAMAAPDDRPLLVLHDPEDAEVPFTNALRNARSWPKARLVRVEGAGHSRMVDRPDVVAAVVDHVLG